ncbi:hypothetical protein [Stenotrophomonas sp. Marseille-Q5258]|uniref:hypothetical protein n=1 Tax=Stenotrophomonas sp. Marseille-Q5258 TaxID=2972779 RepID=UPI0021C9404A|nr:hypothetical protein [Stenotrophomonas sp. Marseille-Q5258]
MADAAQQLALNPYCDGPIWQAFGLGRAGYLVVPRRTLQSMPLEWQQKFVALMDEAQALLPGDAFPEYVVQRRERGRFVADVLREYRHTGPIPHTTATQGAVKPLRRGPTLLPKDPR